jgi:hypothetical protein
MTYKNHPTIRFLLKNKAKSSLLHKHIIRLTIVLFSRGISFAQDHFLYKHMDSSALFLEVYHPEQMDSSTIKIKGIISNRYSPLIFFFAITRIPH